MSQSTKPVSGYDKLNQLFKDFRKFQEPPVENGVPDYSVDAMSEQERRLPEFRKRLQAIDTSGWSISQKVDHALVRAEMNGLEFDHRTLRPWARDPSFYAAIKTDESDVPAREASEVFGALQLFTYKFPLDDEKKEEVRAKLAAIPGVLAHAKKTLTENTKDLYFFAIRQKEHEGWALKHLSERFSEIHPDLVPLIDNAGAAVDGFTKWLKERHAAMPDSADGIGVEEFDWSMKHVHLVPYNWEEQKAIIERELERSWAVLKLEEHRNRHLPPLDPPATVEEMQARVSAAYPEFMDYLRTQDVFTVPDYMALGGGTPRSLVPEEDRDFFTQVDYRNMMPLRCHMIHWLEKQREERNTHPIRSFPLLYNIWDSRAEGFATAFEETMLEAGMMDKVPRARELVYVLLAFRGARAMGDLKMHSREWTLQQAIDYSVDYTPRGWVKRNGDTILGDLGLYLRQPGYGTSYVVGKIQFERLLADTGVQLGNQWSLKGVLDKYFSLGMIPASLIRWEMTGLDDEMGKLSLISV